MLKVLKGNELDNIYNFLTASAQLVDPLLELLSPAVPPASLYTIRGPIYVEPSSLQPPFFARRDIYGPAIVGPPIVGPPFVGPPMMGSQVQMGPSAYVPQPVMSPSPYNPYAPAYPTQLMYDEQQDEVSAPPTRRLNTNVQSGIQQIGQGNMNLQGNIQQVNRRSSQLPQQQASFFLSENYHYQ